MVPTQITVHLNWKLKTISKKRKTHDNIYNILLVNGYGTVVP